MSDTPLTPEWIGLDWGTTHVRAYAMRGGEMLAQARSDEGMGTLAPDGYQAAFDRLTTPWALSNATPVIACGMLGARQGWIEAPYRPVPCTPLAETITRSTHERPICIIPGLSQHTPADVMRGEETQIAGFLALNPGWDGVICLPGTHTKWAELSAGEVVSFQTFMTGEMFALLSQASVLRHSVDAQGWDEDAFVAALSDAMARPERLAAMLFSLRASDLLKGTPGATTRARLSGALIGAELAAARPYWLGRQIAIVGDGAQARAYASGLTAQGVPATLAGAERMTLAGLTTAHRRFTKENRT